MVIRVNLHAMPVAPVGGLYWALDEKANEELCCWKDFFVVATSVTCEQISLAVSVWRLQHRCKWL